MDALLILFAFAGPPVGIREDTARADAGARGAQRARERGGGVGGVWCVASDVLFGHVGLALTRRREEASCTDVCKETQTVERSAADEATRGLEDPGGLY